MANEIPPVTATTIIKPQKANTSNPPSTTRFISTPWFPDSNIPVIRNLTPGGALAGLLGGLGIAHIYHTVNKQLEEGVSSLFNMNNIFLFLFYPVSVVLTYNYTKAPKNLFETNLINSEVKSVIENVRSTIKENKSFMKILDEEGFVKNITTSIDGIMNKACLLLKDKLKEKEYNKYPERDYDERPRRIPLLADLYNKVFSSGSSGKAIDRLKKYIQENGGASFLNALCCADKDLERSVMQALIGVGKEAGTAQKEINIIQNEINQMLIPNGIGLLPIRYNPASGTVDLHFVSLKRGYARGDTSPDPKLTLGGMSISLASADFLVLAEDLRTVKNVVSQHDAAKQVLLNGDISKASPENVERINQEIFSLGAILIKILSARGIANLTSVIYDPKVGEAGGFSIRPLDPGILNSTSSSAINDLMKEIHKPGGAGTTFLSAAIGGMTAAGSAGASKDPEDRKQPEHVPIAEGNPHGRDDDFEDNPLRNLSGWNAFLEEQIRAAAAEKAGEQGPQKPRAEIIYSGNYREVRQRFFEDQCKKLGIKITKNENIPLLTDLKLALIKEQVMAENKGDNPITSVKKEVLSKKIIRKSAEDSAGEILENKKGDLRKSIKEKKPAINDKAIEKEVEVELKRGGISKESLVEKELDKIKEVVFVSDEEVSKIIDDHINSKVKKGKINQNQTEAEKVKLAAWFKEGGFCFTFEDGTKQLYRPKSLLDKVEAPDDRIKLIEKERRSKFEKLYGAIITDYFPGRPVTKIKHPEEKVVEFVGRKNLEYCRQKLNPEACKKTINSPQFGLQQFLILVLEGALQKNKEKFRNVTIYWDKISFEVLNSDGKDEKTELKNKEGLFLELMNISSSTTTDDISAQLEKIFSLLDPVRAEALRKELKGIKDPIDADKAKAIREYEKERQELNARRDSKIYLESQCKELGVRISEKDPLAKLKFVLVISQAGKNRADALMKEKIPVLKRKVAEERIADSLQNELAKAINQEIKKLDAGESTVDSKDSNEHISQLIASTTKRLIDAESKKIEVVYVSDSEMKQIIDSIVDSDNKVTKADKENKKKELFDSFEGKENLDVPNGKGVTIVYKPKSLLEKVKVEIAEEKASKIEGDYNDSIAKLQRVITQEQEHLKDFIDEKTLQQTLSQITLEQVLTIALEGRYPEKYKVF